MDARELRIGNYVYTHNNVVVNLTYERFRAMMQIRDEDLEPTPLTEEWLVKFGFARSDYNDFFLDSFRVELENENVWYLGDPIPSVDINKVHQLQNIYFALTGEELTIK